MNTGNIISRFMIGLLTIGGWATYPGWFVPLLLERVDSKNSSADLYISKKIKLFRSTVVGQCDNQFDGTKLTQLSSNTIFFTIYFVRGLLFNHFPPGKI